MDRTREQGLRRWLEIERESCERLAPILEAERAAAAAYDHAGLLACLKEREAVQAVWRRAAEARREHVRAAGRPLAALVAADPTLAEVMRHVRARAATVRRAQRVNEGLIRAALAQVTDLLTVIRRELPDSRYDGRAALTTPLTTSRSTSWSA
jgi:FlgN protein